MYINKLITTFGELKAIDGEIYVIAMYVYLCKHERKHVCKNVCKHVQI